jgi:hypothetical protein
MGRPLRQRGSLRSKRCCQQNPAWQASLRPKRTALPAFFPCCSPRFRHFALHRLRGVFPLAERGYERLELRARENVDNE